MQDYREALHYVGHLCTASCFIEQQAAPAETSTERIIRVLDRIKKLPAPDPDGESEVTPVDVGGEDE
jgi:hypothetical protein